MKTSTPLSTTPPSILLIGPPGGGKTTLALQFPSVYLSNCDLNTSGPKRYLNSKNLYKDFAYDDIPYDDTSTDTNIIPGAPAKSFDRLMTKLNEAIKEPTVKTIVIDGLTAIDEFLVLKVLDEQKAKIMEIQHWRPFRTYLQTMINTLRSCGKTTLLLCHEESILDKQGTVTQLNPAISTKIKDYFGGFFTDMWRCTSRPGPGGKQVFKLEVLPTPVSELKNSYLMPAVIEDPTFDKLNQYLKL